MHKIALITGATAGIGYACAHQFAAIGYNLIITGRRGDRLQLLADSLQESYNIQVLALNLDVRDRAGVETTLRTLPAEWQKINVLVNNAGLASGLATVQDGNPDDWDNMIDTNIKGLLYVTRQILPYMIANKGGHVVNIGSIAGKEAYPFGNVYCASKAAIDMLSKALRLDVAPHNIKITNISPGKTQTEFSLVRFHGNKEQADAVYEGYTPLDANDVADTVIYVVTRPAHVYIHELTVMASAQPNANILIKE